MGYVESHLQPGEKLIHSATVHWIVYLPAILLAVLALAAWLAIPAYAPQSVSLAGPILGALFGALALLFWLRGFFKRLSTELAVTDRRVIYKCGIVSRRTMEMNRSKVESVTVDQSIWGRLFDYGTVIVKGTGGGLEPLAGIDRPLAFRSEITAG